MKDLIFILSNGASSLTLTHSPDGWDDTLVRYERSTKYWGLFRSFTVQLKFVKEGATYLRNEFYTNGVSALVTCQIKRLNKLTLEYYTAYTAEVDFATFKDEDHMVSVNLVEGGLSALIKKNEKTVYDVYVESGHFIFNQTTEINFSNIEDVFISIVNRITNGGITSGEFGASSQLLNDLRDNVVLTSNYFSEDYYLKTSLDDFFKSINAVFSVGMTIELVNGKEHLIIKPLEYLFTTDVISHFSSINDFVLDVKDDIMFNTVKVGYSDAIDFTNEANSYSVFGFDSPIIKQMDLSSKYRADVWGFRDVGVWEGNADTHDVFFMCIYDEDIYFPDDFVPTPGNIRKTGGTPAGSFFNAYLSPARCIERQRKLLESCVNKAVSLVFTDGGNDNLHNQTQYNGGTWISEYASMTLDLPDAMFIPYTFTIKVPLLTDFNSILSPESLGVITFDYLGNTYKGYVLDIKIKLAGRGEVEFKLLASYDNDLTTLIR